MSIARLMQQAAAGGVVETDPNFANVSLLLHGDGTSGAQNNTFLDGSTNNFTITRNGNTTQGSFSPYNVSGPYDPATHGGSGYFDGSGDYLGLDGGSPLTFGTGDFTIEMWVYLKSLAGSQGRSAVFIDFRTAQGTAPLLYTPNSQNGNLIWYVNSTDVITGSAALSINTWKHIAVSRSSGSTRMFVDGVQVGSTYADTINYSVGANRPFIGSNGTVSGGEFNGYASDVRVIKGTALYTANFTPPTAPLTAVTNTSLLCSFTNAGIFDSTGKNVLETVGNAQIDTAVTKFGTGSMEFDGTGDWLNAGSNAAFAFGTGDFTIELWFYAASIDDTNETLVCTNDNASSNADWQLGVSTDNGNEIQFRIGTGYNLTYPVSVNQWYHLAVVRSGTDLSLYLDGVEVDTAIASNNFSVTGPLKIGENRGGNKYFNGYISDLRIIKGTALYTSAFTPPTAPLTAVTNTSLLCSFTNAGIFDSAAKNVLETVGNAQIDTAVTKFGTGSMEFDGTGDWLKVPNSTELQFGTGDFTVELWVYLATGDTGSNRGLVAKGGASTGWLVSLNTSENVVFTYTTSTITSTASINLDAWNHIAVVREGTGSNETKIYINGTNDGTGTVSTNFNQTEVMYIGANRAAGDPMKGYIDDLRITKGVARYTAAFTPPTKAFPDQ